MKLTGSIRTKVWLCVMVAFSGYLIATLSSFYSNARLSGNLVHLQDYYFPLSMRGGEVLSLYKRQVKHYEASFLTGEKEEAYKGNEDGREIVALIERMIVISNGCDIHDSSRIEKLRNDYLSYFQTASTIYPRAARGDFRPVEKQLQQLGKSQTLLLAEFEGIYRELITKTGIDIDVAKNIARNNTIFILVLFCLVLVIAAVIINLVANRLLITPLQQIHRMINDFARGDLDCGAIPRLDASDEIGALAVAFGDMANELQKTTVSRDYVDNIIRSMTDCLVVVAPEGTIRTVNRTTRELLGYAEDELVGQPVELVFAGESRALFDREGLAARLASASVSNREQTVLAKDGRPIPVLFSASAMVDGAGRVQGIVCVAHDITIRKEAEDAVRESEEYVKNILDSIHAGLVIIDPEAHEIVDANSYACTMIGVPKVQLLGNICHKFICPAEIGACPITDRHETVDNSERLLIKGNDERLPILKSVVPLERKGKTLLIESFIDISQRKQAEEKLQLFAREVQEINEEMRNFAYIVSHDLRAPLVSIKGFSSELDSSIKEMRPLLDKCVASLNEKERKRLDLILQEDIGEALGFIGSSVNRMDGLISNILNLSRLGRKELKIEPVDMTEITRAILASLAHQIEEKRVTVTLAELPELVADKVSMEQIMGNLIDNALKYLEPERDGALSITADRAKDGVTFQVRDNGRGIAQEDMHKVFELFRRAGKQDTKGEGMGLAYVKTLVRRHGGRIWCESAPGVGSTFSFSVAAAVRQGRWERPSSNAVQ